MENTQKLMPEMSEKFDIVIKNLMLAKNEMGSSVKKDALNPFHKSRYASLGAHLDLCETTLDRHGLILLHTINGTHDEALLIATLCHPESGQWIKSYLPLPNPKKDSQGLGAAITYMRRYSINSMLGLNAEDDDGESACMRNKPETKTSAKPPLPANPADSETPPKLKISAAQVSTLRSLENRLDRGSKEKIYNWFKSSYKIDRLEDIAVEKYKVVLGAFENAVKYVEQQRMETANV